MKPIKLTLSGFGSYARETVIEFDKIGSGLFLISGKTGSGKTTIFDGIMYALYGKTSGSLREGRLMRSEYVSFEQLTFVEFVFSIRDQEYTVYRQPAYATTSKRKDKDGNYKIINSSEKVGLRTPDGEFDGRKTEIETEIIHIIGLDSNQFNHIAMLAQGEFRKLLIANSKERKEIFSRIFDTAIFSDFEQVIKDDYDQLKKELEDLIAQYNDLTEKVRIEPADLFTPAEIGQWQGNRTYSYNDNQAVQERLKQVINRQEEEITNSERAIQELEKQREELIADITKAKSINDTLTELAKLENELAIINQFPLSEKQDQLQQAKAAKRLEPLAKRCSENKTEEEKRQAELVQAQKKQSELAVQQEFLKNALATASANYQANSEQYMATINRIKDQLPKYQALSDINSRRTNLEKQIKQLKKDCSQSQEQQKTLETQKKEIAQAQQKLNLLKEEVNQWTSQLTEQEQIREELELAQTYYRDFADLEKQKQLAGQELIQATQHWEEQKKQFSQLNLAYIEAQVGIIAQGLKAGQPCPVCGSTLHPTIAQKKPSDVSQAQLEQANLAEQKAQQKYNTALQKFENQHTQLSGKKDLIHQLQKKCQARYQIAFGDLVSVKTIYQTIVERIKEIEQAIQTNSQESSNLEQIVRSLDSVEIQWNDITNRFEALKDSLNEASTKYQIEDSKRQLLAQELEFPDQQTASQRQQQLEEELEQLRNQQEQAQKEYSLIETERNKLVGLIDSSRQEVAGLSIKTSKSFEELEKAMKESGFETERQYQQALAISSQNLETEMEQHNQRRNTLIGSREAYQKKMSDPTDRQRVDIEQLEQKKLKLDQSLKTIDKDTTDLRLIYLANQEILRSLKAIDAQAFTIRKKYDMVHKLYSVSNGKNIGDRKIDFSTYVQRQYFQSVIDKANNRLKIMSDQQFILQCRELEQLGKRGEVGLDLDIFSFETNSVRDVKTLSGGEQFMAALSMALGLQEVVQNAAGKIRLDMMFIDEGFGSLDNESRENALEVLINLAGMDRMVGIISHVTELKDRVDRKIEVVKTAKGSIVIQA